MYGSVPADAVDPTVQRAGGVVFTPAEDFHLLHGGSRQPASVACRVLAAAAVLTALISGALFLLLSPPSAAPAPAPPAPPKPKAAPKCQPGQLEIWGACRDRSEFLTDPSERAFVFENHASFTVWVAGLGPPNFQPKAGMTGFRMDPGNWTVISLPPNLESVRFWPRTGCRYVPDTVSLSGIDVNITKFRCDTGDCGSILNNYGMECLMVSGLPPATLAEFSLSTKGNDFYDLSNVDGYNVGMKIEPYNFEKAGTDDPFYDCGSPGCMMDTLKCPAELKTVDSEGVTHCLSICQAINSEHQRAQHEVLQDLWDASTDRGFMRDFLCCDCGEGNGLCEAVSTTCTYGCSPFVTSYTDAAYSTRKCDRLPGTFLPKWPNASNGENYAAVFNKQCPQAYSWQFNDDQSTYQCHKADYKISFLSTHKKERATSP